MHFGPPYRHIHMGDGKKVTGFQIVKKSSFIVPSMSFEFAQKQTTALATHLIKLYFFYCLTLFPVSPKHEPLSIKNVDTFVFPRML